MMYLIKKLYFFSDVGRHIKARNAQIQSIYSFLQTDKQPVRERESKKGQFSVFPLLNAMVHVKVHCVVYIMHSHIACYQ